MPNGSNMILGKSNTASVTTSLDQTGKTSTDIFVTTNSGYGLSQGWGGHAIVGRGGSEDRKDAAVWGDGTSYSGGVRGTATYGSGVHGEAMNVGVEGISSGSAGVSGEAQTYSGVAGYSRAPFGTGGEPGQTRFGEGSGVRGIGGNTGVEGFTGRGAGVWGGALSGVGVRGVSQSDTGVFGTSQGFAGVAAISDSRWFGAYAQAWNGTGLVAAGRRGLYAEGRPAAQFVGDVFVSGNLFVTGWKGAVIPQRDGSRRILHALESPEPRFEDFGRARLRRGRAQVRLDRTFALAVRTDDYHVFITVEGESQGLFVARRTRRGFEVREQGGGRSSVGFSYRVVAKRRDVPASRFARAAVPAPVTVAARDLPPKLRGKTRATTIPVADLGPLMAQAWAQTATPARAPRAVKPRRRQR
jgi:hypothetical protein